MKESIRDSVEETKVAVCQYFNDETINFNAVVENSNFNYVYNFIHNETSCYLKIILPYSKVRGSRLPSQRILGENRGVELFNKANMSFSFAEAPKVIHFFAEQNSIILSDVSKQRQNLINVTNKKARFLFDNIINLTESVARFHKATSENKFHQDFGYENDLRDFIFERLIFPGIRAICSFDIENILETMRNNRECLIHSDLWAKNIFVGEDGYVALIDFEGCIGGDPAFDLSTIITMTIFLFYESDVAHDRWVLLINKIVSSYTFVLSDDVWQKKIESRLLSYVAVLVACRISGPFSYKLANDSKESLTVICRDVLSGNVETFKDLILSIACKAKNLNVSDL